MAIIRKKEIRGFDEPTLDAKLEELLQELNREQGTVASGGKASNAGRIRELRRTVARILTIKREKLGKGAKEKQEKKPQAKKPKAPSKKKEEVGKKNA